MKKITLSILILACFAVLLIGGYFLITSGSPNPKVGDAASTTDQSTNKSRIKSFRGVLANILAEIQEKAGNFEEAIAEAVPNPYTDRSNPEKKYSATDSSNFTFAILGDTQRFKAGDSNGNFQTAMASVKKLNPDMVFAVGDLVGNCDSYSKCEKDYTNWKNIIGPLMPKTYATQGNHDRTGGDKTDNIWRSSFDFPTNGPSGYSEQTYSFDFENSHFIFLDSDKPDMHDIDGEQRAWLEKDLIANKKDNTFVFFHEPAFPVSSKVGESIDKNTAERNALWQIFEKYNITGVFNGHEHIVSRRKIDSKVFPQAKNSIYQFVFGDTDSFDHALPDPGIAEYAHREQGCFGLVKVNGKEITVEVYNENGNLLDNFTFSK